MPSFKDALVTLAKVPELAFYGDPVAIISNSDDGGCSFKKIPGMGRSGPSTLYFAKNFSYIKLFNHQWVPMQDQSNIAGWQCFSDCQTSKRVESWISWLWNGYRRKTSFATPMTLKSWAWTSSTLCLSSWQFPYSAVYFCFCSNWLFHVVQIPSWLFKDGIHSIKDKASPDTWINHDSWFATPKV